MKLNYKKTAEFVRFCIVGVICTGIDVGIFFCCRLIAPYQVALICGYLFSLVVNYFLTIHWTFKTHTTIKNAIGVIIAHLFNLFVVRMGLMHIFVGYMGLSDKMAYFPTLFISIVANFLIISFIVKRFS